MIYLDYAATTPLNEEVKKTFDQVLEKYWANSNSLHALGIESKKLFDYSKQQMLDILKLDNSYDILFCGSATTANNLAIMGCLEKYKNKKAHIITSLGEHPSVYNLFKRLENDGFEVSYIRLDKSGRIDLEQLKSEIKSSTVFCSFFGVTNETRAINDVRKIKKIIKEKSDALLHMDTVQMVGKVHIDEMYLNELDFFTLSAHKIYGFKGIGALVKKRNIALTSASFDNGSYMSGTKDVAGIAAFVKALKIVIEKYDFSTSKIKGLNSFLHKKLLENDRIHINTNVEESVPHILNISVFGIKPETIINALSKQDIYVSTKSACSSKSLNESRVLKAMGYNLDIAAHSIRISLSHLLEKEEMQKFCEVFLKVIKQLDLMKK